MAVPQKHLSKMPLVEAFVEIKWQLEQAKSGGLVDRAYPFYVGGIHQLIRQTYPFQEKLPTADFPDEMTPHIVKYRFRPSVDTWPVVQIGSGIASFNSVGKYDWESFKSGASEYFDALNEAYQSASNGSSPDYSQFTLRYINAVEISDDVDPSEFVAARLGTQVVLPGGISKSATGHVGVFNLTIGFPLEYAGAVGVLAIGLGEKDGKRAIIWETTVTSSAERDKAAVADFMSWLRAAHDVVEKWFFTLIAGELEEQFK